MTRSRLLQGYWILYDVASSGYVLLITAVAFPLYFKIHVAGNAAWSEALWGLLLASSSIAAGLISPVIGAAADRTRGRLRYLALATAVCSGATIALAAPGASLFFTSVVFCLSYIAYLVAASLYDALMKTIAPVGSAAGLSALGWGLGYIGGLLCYGMSSAFLHAGVSGSAAAIFSLTFVVVGIYYALLGGIAILGLRTVASTATTHATGSLWSSSFRQVLSTARLWRRGGTLPRMIIGVHLATGAVSTVALFTPIMLSSSFGLSVSDVALLSAIFSLLSIPTTLLAGWLARRIDPLRLLFGLLPVWVLLITLLVKGHGWWAGLAVSLCLGLALGPTNAMARSLVAQLVIETEAAEMFGFAALVNRLTSAIGPLLFGLISSATGIHWPAVLLAATVLIVGFAIIPRTIEAEPRRPVF
jgi:MFS transporter, UMF1 family